MYKVTILARGRTGGHAMTSQEDDKGLYTRDEMFARLVFAMGGRAAEELVFGTPTTGASSDIENATKIARAMLTEYGFSPELGTVKFGQEQGDPFAHMGGGGSIEYSEKVAAKIDEQLQYLLDSAHQKAYEILAEHRDYLDRVAEQLLEKETLRRPDLERAFAGIEPREAEDVFPGEDLRFPQQAGRQPVKTPAELARERGEEPPKRMTLLDASRAARERRLAGKEPASQEEIGFNFGQHAGDVVGEQVEATPATKSRTEGAGDRPAAGETTGQQGWGNARSAQAGSANAVPVSETAQQAPQQQAPRQQAPQDDTYVAGSGARRLAHEAEERNRAERERIAREREDRERDAQTTADRARQQREQTEREHGQREFGPSSEETQILPRVGRHHKPDARPNAPRHPDAPRHPGEENYGSGQDPRWGGGPRG